ncbi:MMPL family transporter [Microbacterium sp. SSW1-59]|uniref:MMPL family transporter n=1 Tax=Microbacterium xanthum TaxID=3079794 RepID=UPI002AD42A55|nr:MMPL family transporter [Microbacterium sp. SSW1-59]MDZ8201841.1 MMPL family transporter [Microbacterium sp. SSW1-59]
MSSFLYRVGRFSARRRWWVIAFWLILAVGGGALSNALGGQLQSSFEIPGTESQNALDTLEQRFPQLSGASTRIVVATSDGSGISTDQDLIVTACEDVAALDDVAVVECPYAMTASGQTPASSGNPAQISDDGSMVYITADLTVASAAITDTLEDSIESAMKPVVDAGLDVAYSGLPSTASSGVDWTEVVGLGIAFVVLAITFLSVIAAGVPLITALVGVGVASSSILIVAAFAPVSSTAPLLATMLGLAVGIDYSLLITSRHRTQLAAGMAVRESVAVAISTAGTAVVFAGLTVMIALLGLAVAGIPFLTVMGVGAAAAVLCALAVAVTLLPAILAVLGRLLRPRRGRGRGRAADHESEARGDDKDPDGSQADQAAAEENAEAAEDEGSDEPSDGAAAEDARDQPAAAPRPAFWGRAVTASPVVTIVVVFAALIALALPAMGLRLTLPDAGYDPEGTTARTAYDMLDSGFGPGFNGPLVITADISETLDVEGALSALDDEFATVPDVASTTQAVPNEALDLAVLTIIPDSAPADQKTAALVSELRAMAPAFEAANGFTYDVTGQTALAIDISDRLGAALPPFALVVVGLCIVLLTIMFRSVAVPVSATVGYLLTVGASLGLATLVFEHGVGADLVGVVKVGPVVSFMPILVMAVLFGLAMDYHVFLVSRMREHFSETRDAAASVLRGFTASARVVTAAALIMFSVFFSFVPGGSAIIQPIALALGVGVLIDAFVVRMTLVPAVMMLLGDKAWWLPAWLERLLPNADIEGEEVQRMLRQREWAEAGERGGVHADALRVGDSEPVTFAARGRDLLLIGGRGAGAVVAAVAGRAAVTEGDLRVFDRIVPFDRAAIARQSAYVPAVADAPAGETVEERLRGRTTAGPMRDEREAAAAETFDRLMDTLRPGDAPDIAPHTPVSHLDDGGRWALDVAAALAGERPLVAIDLTGREPAAALLSVVVARAPHAATLVLATDAPCPVTDRTVVAVAAGPAAEAEVFA